MGMDAETSGLVLSWFRMAAENPFFLFMAIIAATFILEDAATVGAGILAAEGAVNPAVALSALYVGIICGDLGLYGLGYLAAGRSWLRRRIGLKRLREGRRFLDRRLTLTLFGARSIPGLRFPTYTASGFFRVSFVKFALVAIVAAALWTTVFFGLVYGFGQGAVAVLGEWSWVVGLSLIAAALILPRLVARQVGGGQSNGAAS